MPMARMLQIGQRYQAHGHVGAQPVTVTGKLAMFTFTKLRIEDHNGVQRRVREPAKAWIEQDNGAFTEVTLGTLSPLIT